VRGGISTGPNQLQRRLCERWEIDERGSEGRGEREGARNWGLTREGKLISNWGYN